MRTHAEVGYANVGMWPGLTSRQQRATGLPGRLRAQLNDENAKSWLDLASSAFDVIPLPESKLLEFGMGEIKDKVFEPLQPDTVSGAQDGGNTANDQTKNMFDKWPRPR